ncbi:class I SAM-dependent methyltransferase [Actinomadura sp. GTD37]|uniref:class I SAM-dependent methyltransferase n=1 Tax=Actinomadura sp. GTD37 TaxID=1778030 RepID=UPI0035C08B16
MPDTASLRARNLAFWTQTAPGWIRHADRHDELGRPLGTAAMDWLRPRPGERILDVGCGCGGTTAALAEAVAPTGRAVGVDLAESMVAAARRRFPRDRHPGLSFVAADIETVGALPGAPFDAVFSRMALMLLADPVGGCAAIRGSLRPGARLAATVFRDGAANPWLAMAVLGAAPHVGALPPLPLGEEPGPFSFAEPARIERVLTAAGFEGVTVQPHDVTLRVPDEPDAVEWLIEMGPASAAYRAVPPAGQAAARSATAGLLARFGAPGGDYRLPAGLWLITATTPG